MNIIYHFRVRGTGAEGVHIAGIVNGFRSLGHKVRLISPTDIDPTQESLGVSDTKPSPSMVTIILHKLADILPQPFFELMEIAYNLFAIPKLWRAVSNEQVDFIYERYAFFNIAGAFVSKKKKIPLVVEVNELSGHKRVRGQFFVRICSAIERYILRQAVFVITVSDFLNSEVRGKVEQDKTKVVTIPNGVPSAWLKREISPEDVDALRKQYGLQGKKVICFVGSLVHWHNFDLLLDAVRMVQKSNATVSLMLIGDGPLKKYITEKVNELNFSPGSVIFVGNVPHPNIPVFLKLADIAVIPETNDFRSPIKMFEYMALGKAVIAPRMPAIEAVIEDGVDGILFEPGDENSLTGAILRCLQTPQLLRQLGYNAKKKIFGRYTWERHVEHILQIISTWQL